MGQVGCEENSRGCIVDSWFLIYQKPTTYLCQQHRGAIYFLSGMDLVSFTNPLAFGFSSQGGPDGLGWGKEHLTVHFGLVLKMLIYHCDEFSPRSSVGHHRDYLHCHRPEGGRSKRFKKKKQQALKKINLRVVAARALAEPA